MIEILLIIVIIWLFLREGWRPRQTRSDTAHDYSWDYPYQQKCSYAGPYDFRPWTYLKFENY